MASKQSIKDKRFKKVIKNMKRMFDEGKYYDAEQVLKTIFARLLNEKKYDQANKLLIEGSLKLFKYNKFDSGLEIIKDLVELYQESKQKINDDKAKLFIKLFNMIPYNENEILKLYVKYVMNYIEFDIDTKTPNGKKELNDNHLLIREIYLKYANDLWKNKDYYTSSSFFIRSNDIQKHIQLFHEWYKLGNPIEKPYFITRIILQYLYVNNNKNAQLFLDSVSPRDDMRGPSFRHPLINFCDLMIKALNLKSIKLYNMLFIHYMELLKYDEQLMILTKKIGNIQLGIPIKKEKGLLGNLMSMFG